MATFSFRAECSDDANNFQQACQNANLPVNLQVTRRDQRIPDVDIEFEAGTPIEALRDVMREIPDGHVMLETLRECPLAENSLERDTNIS